jgi:hypothetical protein
MANKADNARARRHLAKSLVYKAWQPRVLALLALCCVPPGVGCGLRRFYRSIKSLVRRRGTARQAAAEGETLCDNA